MNSKSKPHSNKVNEASSTILNTNHIKQPNKIISKSKEISNNSNKSKDLNMTTYIECDHNLIKEKRSRNDNSIYKNPNLKSVLSTYNKLSSLNNSLNTKTIKFIIRSKFSFRCGRKNIRRLSSNHIKIATKKLSFIKFEMRRTFNSFLARRNKSGN